MSNNSNTEFAVRGTLALCRAGFESEASAELEAAAEYHGAFGEMDAPAGRGLVVLHTDDATLGQLSQIHVNELIFCRTALPWFACLELPTTNRLAPIVAACQAANLRVNVLEAEFPDTNDGKAQSGFCKRFWPHLEKALRDCGCWQPNNPRLPALHLVFADATTLYLATSLPSQRPAFPMGIPRLKMPVEAPSRSTLKLAEAFLTLLSEDERRQHLKAGMRAVDLGAAPGGWTWQLVSRGIRVTAIDNGPMHKNVMKTEMVQHVRGDGFVWRPKAPVEWLVCDMVEQPSRIATLIADWVASGRARRSIFNLKLPMKKRRDEVIRCITLIDKRFRQAGKTPELRMKQLYHDREEITCYLTVA